jgi:hypothetical protein
MALYLSVFVRIVCVTVLCRSIVGLDAFCFRNLASFHHRPIGLQHKSLIKGLENIFC